MRIAICDDEKVICEYLENVLADILQDKRILYEINSYQSGEELCGSLEREKTDLIFLDIELPDFNGVRIGRIYKTRIVNGKTLKN